MRNFTLSMEDFTIILNSLHYYKKVEKRGNFQQYGEERINALRDELSKQLMDTSFLTSDSEDDSPPVDYNDFDR